MAKPVRPEPKYFLNDFEFEQGVDFYLDKYFKAVKHTAKFIGEKGTSYLEYEYVASRIRSHFPNAKILVILRNPVDRALSNYFFSVQNGLETRTLREVFIQKIDSPELKLKTSVSPFAYLERGHYYELLEPYISNFKDNLKVILFEETKDNLDTTKSIYRFLGVDPDFVPPSINRRFNESNYVANATEIVEVREMLHLYFRPQIKLLEDFMKRKLSLWYDQV